VDHPRHPSQAARRLLAVSRNGTGEKVDTMTIIERDTGIYATEAEDTDVRARIHAEYREMPGLKLTLAQASRLFNIEPVRCRRALEALVSGGVLRTDGRAFLHAHNGRRCA
jgi:hypothetical protein